jgi:hypothetical protein
VRFSRDVASFDSASAMLLATARFLRGRDFPALGKPVAGRALLPLMLLANRLPQQARQALYTFGSGREARPAERVAAVDADDIAERVVGCYPRRPYPGAVIGSSNGALVHLCAALGIPWLPQTMLIPLRHGGLSPDDPQRAVRAYEDTATALLDRNPDLVLHHMLDPNQDRLTSRRLAYFRVKRTTLGPAYERFLRDTLRPGAVILLADCTRRWPTTQVGDRHIFQFGAVGGMEPDEYFRGGPRVREYLRRYGVAASSWAPPQPDGERPEAEWGFEPALGDDVASFARRHGYQLRRLIFEDPQDLSPPVADLYRHWYADRNLPTSRLTVGSFILLDPWRTLRAGAVPYWMTFNSEPSMRSLAAYLDRAGPYDFIDLMVFCHGVESVGLTTIHQWRSLLAKAAVAGRFAGLAPDAYPSDIAVFARYQQALKNVPQRHPVPGPLPVAEFEQFVRDREKDYPRLSIVAG